MFKAITIFFILNTVHICYGISLANSTNQQVHYNSILITGNSTDSRALNHEGVVIYVGNTIRNNIFANNADGSAFEIYPSPEDVIDYNNYYSTGTYLAKVSGTGYSDLDTWRSSESQYNTGSLSEEPSFRSDSDLHLLLAEMDSVGTAISGITEDIDGDMRDPGYPDIGADEYSGIHLNLGLDKNACFGDSVTLDAGDSFDSYQWSSGATNQTIKLGYGNLEEPTEYFKVTVTYEGYQLTDSVAVTFYHPVANAGRDTTACHGQSIVLQTDSQLDVEWYHENGELISVNKEAVCTFSNSEYADSVRYNIEFSLKVKQYFCTDRDTVAVDVYAVPDKPGIVEEDGSLVCSVEGTDYDWYLNGTLMSVHTKSIDPPEEGGYQVMVYNGPCFSEISDTYDYREDVGVFELAENRSISIYPNPAKEKVYIRLIGIHEDVVIRLFNSLGQLLRTYQIPSVEIHTIKPLDISGLKKGMYLLHIDHGKGQVTDRLILE